MSLSLCFQVKETVESGQVLVSCYGISTKSLVYLRQRRNREKNRAGRGGIETEMGALEGRPRKGKPRERTPGRVAALCRVWTCRFSLKGTLNRHTRIHTGIRPHKCPYCGKEFIQGGGLKAHLFHHTGMNGFKCSVCDKVRLLVRFSCRVMRVAPVPFARCLCRWQNTVAFQ